jgi:hypothetical protein
MTTRIAAWLTDASLRQGAGAEHGQTTVSGPFSQT